MQVGYIRRTTLTCVYRVVHISRLQGFAFHELILRLMQEDSV